MSNHNINIKEENRIIYMCGISRIELFSDKKTIKQIEFCSVCGKKLEEYKPFGRDKNDS